MSLFSSQNFVIVVVTKLSLFGCYEHIFRILFIVGSASGHVLGFLSLNLC